MASQSSTSTLGLSVSTIFTLLPAQTELSITVNVRFTNNANHDEDFERQFTASKSYETTKSLNSVQEELVTQMVKDLAEQIFNATVANW